MLKYKSVQAKTIDKKIVENVGLIITLPPSNLLLYIAVKIVEIDKSCNAKNKHNWG